MNNSKIIFKLIKNHNLCTANDLQVIYLDFLNDFLTIERFAEYYETKETLASELIQKGRKIHNIVNDK